MNEREMNEREMADYVKAAALALELPMDEARVQAVAQVLARTAAMAKELDAFPLAAHDELAEIFRPAPFPPVEDDT